MTRSDARRNRARLVEVAAQAFRDEGLDVGVDAIARRAGVGVATLYRHFPAKTDLILAVMDAALDELQEVAAEALARGRPDQSVARFLRSVRSLQCRNRGLMQALAEHELPAEARLELMRRTITILAPVADAGHRGGTIRPELGARDLLVVVRMLGVVDPAEPRRAADRYLALLLRGLAVSAGPEVAASPGRP
jgi:AcrR family transcriptional regulator